MSVEVETAGLNEFELQRARLIARNRARLLALGIPEAVSGLSKLAPPAAAPKPKKPRTPKAAAPAQPTRQSSRLRDQQMIARGEVPPDIEPGSELAMFIIDGECPTCGKVLHVGHARHLDNCQGPPEPPPEEEIAAQAEAYKVQQTDKLRQLELGGLVDYVPGGSSSSGTAAAAAAADITATGTTTEGAAATGLPAKRRRGAAAAAAAEPAEEQQQQQVSSKAKKQKKAGAAAKQPEKETAAAAGGGPDEAYATFIVVGSTGNHYVVKLTDTRRSCTCMDHRIRRRDCKHIRLIWEQLGIADKPQDWKQALERQLIDLASAEQCDVEMVRQAEGRRKARAEKQAAAAAATRKRS